MPRTRVFFDEPRIPPTPGERAINGLKGLVVAVILVAGYFALFNAAMDAAMAYGWGWPR